MRSVTVGYIKSLAFFKYSSFSLDIGRSDFHVVNFHTYFLEPRCLKSFQWLIFSIFSVVKLNFLGRILKIYKAVLQCV